MKTNTESTHTAYVLPLRICDSHFVGSEHHVTICDARNVVVDTAAKELGAVIVKAVNNHAELVQSLRALLNLETRYTNVGRSEFDSARALLARL